MQTIRALDELTDSWGTRDAVSLYLDRCQIDTPRDLVSKVWDLVRERRPEPVTKVVDFGAGDARFADITHYTQYCGYEIDVRRFPKGPLPERATLFQQCSFSAGMTDADLCIGNPPYVRNQDLPSGWRQSAATSLFDRTGTSLSGLANAWQYFFLLALASTKADGLVALLLPYEWVSRPSVQPLRALIRSHRWHVSVYRLRDKTFKRVLTTSSVTVVDKRQSDGHWQFFEEDQTGRFSILPSATGSHAGAVRYLKRSQLVRHNAFAKRGLSPGTQKALVLTEGQRVRAGLKIQADVVPCITSLRSLPTGCDEITDTSFATHFRFAGRRCWLIRTDRTPSMRLRAYLETVPSDYRQTATCVERDEWWKFSMPAPPPLLVATGFRAERPKIVINSVAACAVGSVAGIYGISDNRQRRLVEAFNGLELAQRIVSHSNGLRKVEIHQLNALLAELFEEWNT